MLNPYPPAWFAATRLGARQQAARQGGRIAVFVAIAVGTVFQVVRLQEGDPTRWLALDYGMRIVVLLILAVPTALRRMVYQQESRDAHIVETIFWTLVIALFLW